MSVQNYSESQNKSFGAIINRLIQGRNLTRQEAKQAFTALLNNHTNSMQQGAFLAALTAKGETEAEVAAGWEAIYELDTAKVEIGIPDVAENSGTGMDTLKTFNISTAAAIIAAAGGIPMARHGSRAITSISGTVDIAEALGVDVECTASTVAHSIKKCGMGLFNGMSPHIHPTALGSILSQIHFGSTLNLAASLANPALPAIGVRGVCTKNLIMSMARVMRTIGYKRALVLHGSVSESDKSMDEASVCGTTYCAELTGDGQIHKTEFSPQALGLAMHPGKALAPENDLHTESKRFAALMINKENGARKEAVLLNAGLIFYAADKARTIDDGIHQAACILEKGMAFKTLEKWVGAQNNQPKAGLNRLYRLMQ